MCHRSLMGAGLLPVLTFMLLIGTWCAEAEINTDEPAYAYAAGYGDGVRESYPELGCDSEGNCIGVTQGAIGGMFGPIGVFAMQSADYGVTWTTPVQLNANLPERCAPPKIAWGGGSTWIVTWSLYQGFSGGEVDLFFTRSTNGGNSWTTPELLNTNGDSDGERNDFAPRLATDGAGNWVAVWHSYLEDATDIRTARSTNNGQTWTAPAVLAWTEEHPDDQDLDANVTTDRNGTWVCVWVAKKVGEFSVDRLQLYTSRSTDNGATWSTPNYLVPESGMGDDYLDKVPSIATDGNDRWLVAWRGDSPEAAGSDHEILLSSSDNDGLTWSLPAVVNSTGNDDGAMNDESPSLAWDGTASWVCTWESAYNLNGTAGTDSDIFAAVSRDSGSTWSDVALLNSTATLDGTDWDGTPVAVPTGVDTWRAAWSSGYDLGAPSDSEAAILHASFSTEPTGVFDFQVSPTYVKLGDTATITFKVGADLLNDPVVRVNGNLAQRVPGSKSTSYTYEYLVPGAPLGAADIEVTITETLGDTLVFNFGGLFIATAVPLASTTLTVILAACLGVGGISHLRRKYRAE